MSSDLLSKAKDAIAVVESGMAEDADLIRAYDMIDTLRAKLKGFQEALATAAIAHLGDREFVNGDVRYYVGKKKTKKVVATGEVAAFLLERGGPDELVRYLASGAFKPGSLIKQYGSEMPAEWIKEDVKDELIVKRARVLPGGKDSDDAESE